MRKVSSNVKDISEQLLEANLTKSVPQETVLRHVGRVVGDQENKLVNFGDFVVT